MNSILDVSVQRFVDADEDVREEFRGQLTAYRNLYSFLSQIIPYQDIELEKLYTFVRNLMTKLPSVNKGGRFTLDDEVALKFYRLQQMSEGTINLGGGEADPLKGPTDVGTGKPREEDVTLSSLVETLNERFGTDFTKADQLFFDQVCASAEEDDKIVEAVQANNFENFSAYFDRIMDELFVDRIEGNEQIVAKVISETSLRSAAQAQLAREIRDRIRRRQREDA